MDPYEHRRKYKLDSPESIGDFKIDDYVYYNKEGTEYRGYIYCFREFGYTWFAWIYTDKSTMNISGCVAVDQLVLCT